MKSFLTAFYGWFVTAFVCSWGILIDSKLVSATGSKSANWCIIFCSPCSARKPILHSMCWNRQKKSSQESISGFQACELVLLNDTDPSIRPREPTELLGFLDSTFLQIITRGLCLEGENFNPMTYLYWGRVFFPLLFWFSNIPVLTEASVCYCFALDLQSLSVEGV